MPASEKELMGASTALLVLAALNTAPSYGYELLRRINDQAQGLFTWQEGTLYPVLHRLETDGLLRAQWQDADAPSKGKTGGGARRRKYYYITAKGRKHLAQSTAQWQAFNELVTRITGVAHGIRKPAIP